jgi:hypothetical protein
MGQYFSLDNMAKMLYVDPPLVCHLNGLANQVASIFSGNSHSSWQQRHFAATQLAPITRTDPALICSSGLPRSGGRGHHGYAAQESYSQEIWHLRLADCFEAFAPGSERLLPAKLKVSFPLFARIFDIWANGRTQPETGTRIAAGADIRPSHPASASCLVLASIDGEDRSC